MNRFVHFEIAADNTERATEFYRSVFGWQFQKWEGPMEYHLAMTGDEKTPGINGGLYPRDQAMNMPGIVNTLDVESIDETLQKVTSAGGTVVMPKHEIPGIGQLAYCTDSEGNTFGVIQPLPRPDGGESQNS